MFINCKSCKICCYFSFKLNWDRKHYFFEINNHKPTAIYLFIFKTVKPEKIFIGASAWSCCANFVQVNAWWEVSVHYLSESEASSEPCQISQRELIAKIVNGFWPLTVFEKSSILDFWKGSECILLRFQNTFFQTSALIASSVM